MGTRIRLASAADAEQVREVYAPWCSTPVSFEEAPPSLDEMVQRITTTTNQFPWLVCDHDGRLWGYAYASRHRERAAYRWSVDVSVYIASGRRRSGVARALYTSLFAALVKQGFINAYAGVTLPNPGSVGLHESFGFRPVGVYHGVGYKSGTWHDVGWWELELQPCGREPVEPLGVDSLLATREWEGALAAGLPFLRP